MRDQYVDQRPDDTRLVEVEWRGGWYAGELQAYRRVGGDWSGFVRFTTGLAETRIDWFPEDRIHPVDEPTT
jgi:hypothetical protein